MKYTRGFVLATIALIAAPTYAQTPAQLLDQIDALILNGYPNGANNANGVTTLTVTGNTFADAASALKKNLPQNTFLARVDWDAAVAALVKP